MDTSFWLKLGLSCIVGGLWVTLSTVAAERYGSKIGGFIGGLPSTVVVSLFFIGLTQTSGDASQATTIMPLVQGFNGIFILTYILFAARGLLVSLSGALLIWFLLASVIVAAHIQSFWISTAGWLLMALGCYAMVEKVLTIPSREKIDIHYASLQILFRAFFGGSVIAFAVFMGKLGGPVYGGIFATFPAMFISTIIITHRTGGPQFSRAVAKTLMVSGLINVIFYVTAARYFYLWTGLIPGTILALLCSCGIGYLTHLFIRSRLS